MSPIITLIIKDYYYLQSFEKGGHYYFWPYVVCKQRDYPPLPLPTRIRE
jgi:hypothetical protein